MRKLSQLVSHLKIAWYGVLTLLIILMIVLSAWNSEAVSAIKIKLIDGVTEHKDKRIPLLQKKEDSLPDYLLAYRANSGWIRVGTAVNQSAEDWITFGISDPPSLQLLQSIRVSDDDIAENDLLDEIQVTDTTIHSAMFRYELETVVSLKAGMNWFATTPLGKAIFTAIALAVFLVILSHWLSFSVI